ncbi:alanine racemase [Selenomonas sp. TAMA-11512]|uniref:alanine racemase n=1 Tax=Selenomonas sp. TAMA-11512 TaxID=3095337 RepID=UPI00308F940A|nr:alanine racemase [Selenomonas sp. TAMA-11512]
MSVNDPVNRSAWAEIDCSALRSNYRLIRKRLPETTRLCAVVKANGYGHGAIEVAKIALSEGATYLGAATPDEGVELREAGIDAPILVLGLIGPESVASIVKNDITQTVATEELAKQLDAEAAKQGKKVKVHLKVETGMGRIGVCPEDASALAGVLEELSHVELEGIFSHFSVADSDLEFTKRQIEKFKDACAMVEQVTGRRLLRHIAESEAILRLLDISSFDMVRAGIIQYGLKPGKTLPDDIELRQAMRLKAKIVFIKEIEPGQSIGYGRKFIARRKSRIATLPLGYADGYIRAYGNEGSVEIKGKRAPIAGRICMDQTMIDITDIDGVEVGDEVTLFGSETLTTDEAARWLDTINYEIVCLVSSRVPRVYVGE